MCFGLSLLLFLWLGLIDAAHAIPADRRATVQPIQVLTDDGTAGAVVGLFEPETDKIWSQAGIDIHFLDITRLRETDFLILDDETEVIELLTQKGHGQNPNPLILNMWFVETILPATTFGLAWLGANGIAIAGDVFTFNGGIGRLDTIAHEIGHNLGLPHADDAEPLNVMAQGDARVIPSSISEIVPDGAQTDQLTDAQVRLARDSPFVIPMAEPVSLYLLVLGVFLPMVRQRVRERSQHSRGEGGR